MRIVWTIAIGLSVVVLAQAQGGQEGRGGGRGRFQGPNIGFTAVDLNGDGVLDAVEIQAAPKSLAKLDKDGDGQITSDEARQAMPQGRGRGEGGRGEGGRAGESEAPPVDIVAETVKALMAFDANGDGKLSRAELPDRFQGIFDRGDLNKDGFLTVDEIRKVAAAQAAPQDAGGEGERRGGEGGRGPGGRGGEMNFIRMDGILAVVDANRDGVISAEELRNAAAAIRKLDKDSDGTVTRAEATPAPGPGRQN